MPRDPVRGMEIDEKDAAAVSEHRGKTYYFCSAGCKEKFDEDERGTQFESPAPSAVRSSVGSDVVQLGGVAKSHDETDDVTRDTYGFPSGGKTTADREERIARADRAAAQVGMPGVDVPESPLEGHERSTHEAPRRKPKRG